MRIWQDLRTGRVLFHPSKKHELGPEQSLPCGKCIRCRVTQVSQLATRIEHEALAHEFSSFLTLTYADEHFPRSPGEWRRNGAVFQHQLRDRGIRSVVVHELGDQFGRPHHHAALFGEAFLGDRKPFGKSRTGHQLWSSADLNSLWPFGHAYIEDLTAGTARYLAGYVVKKLDGRVKVQRLQHPATGALIDFPVVMRACLPRSPGLGVVGFRKFEGSMLSGLVDRGGVHLSFPRAYRNDLEQRDPVAYAEWKAQQELARQALPAEPDESPERVAVIEEVMLAKLKRQGR